MILGLPWAALSAPPTETLSLDLEKPTAKVSRSLFGIFFEEINNAGEGGLYGELLNNRALVKGKEMLPAHWTFEGSVVFDESEKVAPSRAGSLIIDSREARSLVENSGFWGVPTSPGKPLKIRLWIKGAGSLSVSIVDENGSALSKSVRLKAGPNWKEAGATLEPTSTSTKGRLRITGIAGSKIALGYASLMPSKTWHGRPNGLRTDLAERLAALSPGFVRFPGGCYVEGHNLGNCFDWRSTLQSIEKRPATPVTFWGYPSSNGLGYHEYLQLCEDLKSEPMFVINCGMSHSEITPMSDMNRHVKDALDAIEYANGPVSSKMGALRAANGHPKPFHLKYIEIGNENGYSWSFGGQAPYYERFALINKAIKAKHPEITTISNVPVPTPGDLVSEHYYDNPGFFWSNRDRYAKYPRSGPRIYVGEYAVTRGTGRGSLGGALGEAAYMTGMERNADVVAMASYAPLFENVNNRQWNPNAIVFDNTRSYGIPSYWVQTMFAKNRVDAVVDLELSEGTKEAPPIAGHFGFRTWHTSAEFKDLSITINGRSVYQSAAPKLDDLQMSRGSTWTLKDGALTQTDMGDDRTAVVKGVAAKASDSWTYEFTARAVSGDEGFMAIFGHESQEETLQWNLGGWGNTEHAFQRNSGRVGRSVKGRINPGDWYKVKIEKSGDAVKAYLNGVLVADLKEEPVPSLAASAGVDLASKDLIIKVVNSKNNPRTISLKGAPAAKSAQVVELTADSLAAENSLDQPERVMPKSWRQEVNGGLTVKPRSLTIIRIPLSSRVLDPIRRYASKRSK